VRDGSPPGASQIRLGSVKRSKVAAAGLGYWRPPPYQTGRNAPNAISVHIRQTVGAHSRAPLPTDSYATLLVRTRNHNNIHPYAGTAMLPAAVHQTDFFGFIDLCINKYYFNSAAMC
jgi:hypothetical protein